MKLTDTHKLIIVGTLVFFGVLGFMVGTDTTINDLFKNHQVNETHPITNITVTGDGSSGTGDVQNVQQTTVVSSATTSDTAVSTTQSDTNTARVTVSTTDSLSGTDYTPD